ncbi:MAG: D-hexose-6-phosphate mutarotase [Lentisphaeria bacterium]|nr:D-hexose-6-phosphate mutarotase [Lentisphaeria bacterium]
MQVLDALNHSFGLAGELRFAAGDGGLPVAEITNAHACAAVSLHGGHVLAYQPTGAKPVLWVSERSWHEPLRPIRGGIPICWPWFGAHPDKADLPSHGLARVSLWNVRSTATIENGTTELVLELGSKAIEGVAPFPFELSLRILVGETLRVELTTRNLSDKPVTFTQALHTYFSVGDVRHVTVGGFDGCPFTDTVPDGSKKGLQRGPVSIDAETDLVFLDCLGGAWVDDPVLGRRIRIRKSGSNSAVVWNPWKEKSARMPDFGDEEYSDMLCVETTNAPGDEACIAVGQTHTLAAEIKLEPLDDSPMKTTK